MLKSSFSPAGCAIAVTMPSAMSSTCVSVRVCSPEPKICERALARQRLADQVGHGVRDARLVVRQLAGPVGVEGPADRVRAGRARRAARGSTPRRRASRSRRPSAGPGSRAGAPRWSGTRSRARTPSTTTRRRGAPPRSLERRPEDRVVEAVVHLEQRVRELVEVGDPADDRRQVDHVRAAADARARASSRSRRSPVWTSQRLAHPRGRLALVGHAHLPAPGRRSSRAHDGRADRAGAAGDEHAAHCDASGSDARARVREHLRRRRSRSTGRPRAVAARGSARRARPSKRGVVGGDHHGVGAVERRRRAARDSARHVRVVARRRRPARARAAGSACSESESRTSSESRLKVSPSTATLRSRSEPPSRRLRPSTRNSGTRLVHARDGQQHAGRARALLGEREVLAQAGAGGQARAARSRRAGSRG